MTTFMTRVELHGANYQDYENLHAHMTLEGFTNTILADDGTAYQLPPAEYNLIDNCTLDQAREKAGRAAQKTRKTFAVLVSQYSAAAWVGLGQVQRRARA